MMIERALKGTDEGKLLLLGVVAREMGCFEEKGYSRGRYEAIR